MPGGSLYDAADLYGLPDLWAANGSGDLYAIPNLFSVGSLYGPAVDLYTAESLYEIVDLYG